MINLPLQYRRRPLPNLPQPFDREGYKAFTKAKYAITQEGNPGEYFSMNTVDRELRIDYDREVDKYEHALLRFTLNCTTNPVMSPEQQQNMKEKVILQAERTVLNLKKAVLNAEANLLALNEAANRGRYDI